MYRTETAYHEAQVAELYLKRTPVAEISEILGISQGRVQSILVMLRQRWKTSADEAYEERRAQELAAIDRLELEYWTAWERSKREKTTRRVRSSSKGAGESVNAVDVVEQVGNPAFLAGVMSCIEKRSRMFGLDAPEKHMVGVKTHGSTAGTPIEARLSRYEEIIVGLITRPIADGDPALNGAGESVGTVGPAREASGVLDVLGTER